MSRTVGIIGKSSDELRSNSSNLAWARQSEGSYDGTLDGDRPRAGDNYIFSIYKDGDLVATEFRPLLTILTAATSMKYMNWHENGSDMTDLFNPSMPLSGLQTSLWVNWISNPYAELIEGIWVSQTNGDYDNATKFKLGQLRVNATPSGTDVKFTSLTGVLNYESSLMIKDGYREIGMRYRTTDGTKKTMSNYYYP